MRIGKNLRRGGALRAAASAVWMAAGFMGIEVFLRHYVCDELIYPLLFSAVWAVLLTAVVLLFPPRGGRVVYGLIYYVMMVYAVAQAGYYQIFGKMMWLTDIRYAGEGAEFAGSVFAFLTRGFYISIGMMLVIGAVGIALIPPGRRRWPHRAACAAVIAAACGGLAVLPGWVFQADGDLWGAQDEYRRALSLEGTYDVMYDARKVYRICGLYQYTMRDIYKHLIVPHTPAYAEELERNRETVDAYFDARGETQANGMTGLFEGKNVIVVLMESVDDWLIDEELTPNLCRLMDEGINFTNMYTPGYGGVRTFNTEFCANTGIYLPTDGNLAFSYCNNDFSQSLPNLLRARGYSAASFHYNQAIFYNRGVMHPAMGFEEYVSYTDYVDDSADPALLSDTFQFDNEAVREKFFGGDSESGRFCSFLITRAAHMPYTYDDELSQYALAQYPEFQGKTGHEEVDCLMAKTKLVDDLFGALLDAMEETGHLDDTVIVAYTDHYVYGMTDKDKLFEQSAVDDTLLLEKTPCFIWANGMQPVTVDKVANTADILPTVCNLLGVQDDDYLGRDVFDEDYAGYVIFPSGDWLTGGVLYRDGAVNREFYPGAAEQVDIDAMNKTAQEFIEISNLLLKCDYYAKNDSE